MIKWVLGIGVALVVLGVGGYAASGAASWTALIPAFVGLVFVLLAAIGSRGAGARKHAMHAAAAVALIVAVGTAQMSLPKLIGWMGGTTPARPGAVIAQAITAVLCVVLLALAIRSFIQARRARAGSA